MANLTKSQRYNKNLNEIFDFYNNHQNNLPSVHLYTRYLEIAVEKLKMDINKIRDTYGLYTVKQWEALLGLGWNK